MNNNIHQKTDVKGL